MSVRTPPPAMLDAGPPAGRAIRAAGRLGRDRVRAADHLRRGDRAEPPGLDDLTEPLQDRVEAAVVGDGQHDSGPLRRRDDLSAVPGRDRQRLLAEDVLAGLDGGERMLGVQMVWRADEDGVDLGVGAQLLDSGVRPCDAVRPCVLLGASQVRPRDRDDTRAILCERTGGDAFASVTLPAPTNPQRTSIILVPTLSSRAQRRISQPCTGVRCFAQSTLRYPCCCAAPRTMKRSPSIASPLPRTPWGYRGPMVGVMGRVGGGGIFGGRAANGLNMTGQAPSACVRCTLAE